MDTRTLHGMKCYCEQCCYSALDWWEWRSRDDSNASGSRYWTKEDALADMANALADGLPILCHAPDYEVQEDRYVNRPGEYE